MKKIYDDVDETFLASSKPKDPFEIVDRRTQKIEINPGIPYKSTSHDEVFELRAKLVQEKALAEKNKYLKPPKHDSDDDSYIPADFFKPSFEPYQCKTRYQITETDPIAFDSDDEDNLIIASQPYDTIQNIGFKDILT